MIIAMNIAKKIEKNRENQFNTSAIETNQNDIINFEIQKIYDERVEKKICFNCDSMNH